MRRMSSLAVATAALLALPLAAQATVYQFNAGLAGSNETAPNASAGTGVATLFYNDFNVVVAALRFFYGTTLGRPDTVPFIAYGKRTRSIPAVLSVEEVRALFEAAAPGRDRVLLQTAYACGLASAS